MDKKFVAKRYLIITTVMAVVFNLVSFLLVFGVSAKYGVEWSNMQKILISFAAAYIPCASFTGFCICFIRVKELTKKAKIILCFFNIAALAAITVIGIVATVPYIIYSVAVLLRRL